MKISELKIDEDFKNLLPSLTEEQFNKLEQDILIRGVLDPILVWNGYVTDGHNRLAICKKHGITEVETKNLPLLPKKSDVMQWIIDHQLGKRNLTKSQLVRSYESVEQQIAREAAERVGGRPKSEKLTSNLMQVSDDKKRNPTTAAQIAEKIGVSENTYRDMKLVVNNGTPEQVERMDKGGKGNSVNAIAKEIKTEAKEKEEKKYCTKCQRMLPISNFSKNKSRKDGVQDWCRDCDNEMKRKKAVESMLDEKAIAAMERVKSPDTDTSVGFDTFYEELEASVESFVDNFGWRIKSNAGLIDSNEKVEKIKNLCKEVTERTIKEIEKELTNGKVLRIQTDGSASRQTDIEPEISATA